MADNELHLVRRENAWLRRALATRELELVVTRLQLANLMLYLFGRADRVFGAK
ncbi:MAG: hypothetical protein ACYCW6_00160 [Candidatus Xenobia bacterium]